MSSNRELFKFEQRKVFTQKAYWCALAVMMIILVVNEFVPVMLGNYRIDRTRQQNLSGTVIDEKFLEEIKKSDNYKDYAPIDYFIKTITGKTDFSEVTEESLYQDRTTLCEKLLDDARLSEKEKDFWRESDQQNKAPFTYTYDGAYYAFFEIAGYFDFMVLIVCAVGLSGVFADERHKSTDQLIFCTRLGRKNLFWIKTAVGVLTGLFSALVIVATEWILCITLYGTSGFSEPIQIRFPVSMLHISMGEGSVLLTVLFLLTGAFLGLLTMFLSQITMNHSVTMAAMIFFMILCMFNLPSSLGWLATLWSTMPGIYVGTWLFEISHVLRLGGITMKITDFSPCIWLVGAIILLLVMVRCYKRYEVKAQ